MKHSVFFVFLCIFCLHFPSVESSIFGCIFLEPRRLPRLYVMFHEIKRFFVEFWFISIWFFRPNLAHFGSSSSQNVTKNCKNCRKIIEFLKICFFFACFIFGVVKRSANFGVEVKQQNLRWESLNISYFLSFCHSLYADLINWQDKNFSVILHWQCSSRRGKTSLDCKAVNQLNSCKKNDCVHPQLGVKQLRRFFNPCWLLVSHS